MPRTPALDRALKWLSESDGAPVNQPRPPKDLNVAPGSSARQRSAAGIRGTRRANPNSRGDRHDRKCSVCRHPERAEIEREFLHWRSAEIIAQEYGIAHHSSIYRHAHAAGLFAQRATHLKI